MILLIGHQPLRLGKRDNDDCRSAPIEFTFDRFHLAEVALAGQSGKMPEKDEQCEVLKVGAKGDSFTAEFKEVRVIDFYNFHGSPIGAKKGALRPGAP